MSPAPEPAYANVEPLVAACDTSGPKVSATFRCPLSGFEVVAEAAWPEGGVGGKAKWQAKATANAMVRDRLASSIRRAASSTGFGAMGAHAATGALFKGSYTNKHQNRSEENRQAAVVDAFESVADLFGWDEGAGRWVAANALPATSGGGAGTPAGGAAGSSARAAFFDHLRTHPLGTDHDRDVLVRMLASVIAMDGAIGDEEREVFATFVGPEHDLEAIASRGSPGEADMAATAAGPTRETLLLLAWAVALTDEDLGEGERALLDWFGRALYLPAARVEELRGLAAAQVAS